MNEKKYMPLHFHLYLFHTKLTTCLPCMSNCNFHFLTQNYNVFTMYEYMVHPNLAFSVGHWYQFFFFFQVFYSFYKNTYEWERERKKSMKCKEKIEKEEYSGEFSMCDVILIAIFYRLMEIMILMIVIIIMIITMTTMKMIIIWQSW